jgi:hypothetical protein
LCGAGGHGRDGREIRKCVELRVGAGGGSLELKLGWIYLVIKHITFAHSTDNTALVQQKPWPDLTWRNLTMKTRIR